MNSIFFDLDGTIVDSSLRQYSLFIELSGGCPLSHQEYWCAKRNGANQMQMLEKYTEYPIERYDEFRNQWMANIEAPGRVATDVLFTGADHVLQNAHKIAKLFIVTGRQNGVVLKEQLINLNIAQYFDGVFNTNQTISKADIIRRNVGYESADYIIGDTPEDIMASRDLGIKGVGITTGSSAHSVLTKYNPHVIVNSLSQFLEIL